MRKKICICSVVYEKARPYLLDFMTGVLNASQGHDVKIVIINDGLHDIAQALCHLTDALPVTWFDADVGSTRASVRWQLFNRLRTVTTDVVIFTDCDDILEPDAIARHTTVLGDADFSYADQELMSHAGVPLGMSLYRIWQPPDHVDEPIALAEGNFIGFSGAAIRHACLRALHHRLPDSVVAVDWWFFTMLLLAGMCGKRASAPVVRYRQAADSNALYPSWNADVVRRRCATALAHFTALPDCDMALKQRNKVRRLWQVLDINPAAIKHLAPSQRFRLQGWYADIMYMAERQNDVEL